MPTRTLRPLLVVGTLLAAAAGLGAPAATLLALGAAMTAPAVLTGGTGASAASNLARMRHDRRAWEQSWDAGYMPGETPPRHRADREQVPASGEAGPIPPEVLPDDLRASREWMRTAQAIRALPTAAVRPGSDTGRRRGRRPA